MVFLIVKLFPTLKSDSTSKTTEVNYTISLTSPYRMEKYEIERDSIDSLALYSEIEKSMNQTFFKKDARF